VVKFMEFVFFWYIFSKWVHILLQQTINFFPYIVCVCITKQSLKDEFSIHILIPLRRS